MDAAPTDDTAARRLTRPGDSHRITILGATGSGKTQAGLWHLSRASFDRRPWVIFDFKRDPLISQLRARSIDIDNAPPRGPGLYIVRLSQGDDERTESFLWNVHRRTGIGLFVDEGYMLPKFPAYNAYRTILTQGRSLNIPVITLSQRPVSLDRFAFTEASFWQIFRLQSEDDRKTVEGYLTPNGHKGWLSRRLPRHHSWWYDVENDQLRLWSPTMGRDRLIGSFRRRLGRTVYV